MKKNKWRIILTSLVILLPMIAGFMLWNELPEKIATHWGMDGEVNGWSSRLTVVVWIPIFLLLVHLFCIAVTMSDRRNKNQSKKVIGMVCWICPLVSLFMNGCIYASAFGRSFDMSMAVMLFFGLFYLILGNYLPKCKQNYFIGIRIPWTLLDEENWNATHRFTGKLFVVCGLVIMAGAWISEDMLIYAIVIMTVIPLAISVLYSYVYYKKQWGVRL